MEEAVVQIKNAIVSGRTDIVNALLQQGSKLGQDPGQILRENILPEGSFLHFATTLDHHDIVRALLNAGADPSSENKDGENAYELCRTDSMQQVYIGELLRATARSNVERIDEFFKAGLNPNSYDCEEKRNSILHWAVSFADAGTVGFLIEKGCDVNSLTSESVTPLHDAVDRGEISIIEILLKAGASPLIKAEHGKFENQSPLDLASQKPEVFALISHYLASQFKALNLSQRSGSIDSVSVFSPTCPESPAYPSMETMRMGGRQMSCSSVENFSHSLHAGFEPGLEGVIRGLELKAPIQPIITDSHLSNLWPQPKTLMCLEGLHFRPDKVLHVSVVKSPGVSVHRILDIFSSYKEVFETLGFRTTCSQIRGSTPSSFDSSSFLSSQVQCGINAEVFPGPSFYKLHISSQKVRITAADVAGLRYGISTFLQLLILYSSESEPTAIPPLVINDNPSLKHRGIFLDVSSERIPNIECLFELIRALSLFKINYVHLHMRVEKTRLLLPYSKGELIAIDRLCEDVGIVLIPAFDIPCSVTVPEYFEHVKPVINDILPCFASTSYVHIGPQLTSLMFHSENEQNGRPIGFNTIWNYIPVSSSDSTILLCHNAVTNALKGSSPATLLNVPSNIVLVEYGFQADFSFKPSLQELGQNGCTSLAMAGTSAWSSLAGCPEAALCNLYHGNSNAVSNSSLGLIVANWSGSCNLIPLLFAWPGFLVGAGLSWNHQTHWEYLQGSLAHLMSTYVLKDKSGIGGQVVLQLGCAESSLFRTELAQSSTDMSNLPPSQGTTLYRFLTAPDSVCLENLSLEAFIKCVKSIKKCQNALLFESKLQKENILIYEELCLTVEMLLLSCRIGRRLLSAGMNPRSNMGLTVVNLGIANLQPTVRSDIANKLLIIIEDYQRIWASTNYPQGLETSLFSLTTTLQRFIPDSSKLISGRLSSGGVSSKLTNGHGDQHPDSPRHNGRS